MGQAKLRGTFEQRQHEGIIRRQKLEIEKQEKLRLRQEALQQKIANMTPEQRKKYQARAMLLASAMALSST